MILSRTFNVGVSVCCLLHAYTVGLSDSPFEDPGLPKLWVYTFKNVRTYRDILHHAVTSYALAPYPALKAALQHPRSLQGPHVRCKEASVAFLILSRTWMAPPKSAKTQLWYL